MTNTLATFTPAMIQRVANENGWDTKEYGDWRRVFSKHDATIHVQFSTSGAVNSAWVHVCCDCPAAAVHPGGDWFMLDNKNTGKREIVLRWLAGDFDGMSEYALQ